MARMGERLVEMNTYAVKGYVGSIGIRVIDSVEGRIQFIGQGTRSCVVDEYAHGEICA